MNTILSLSVAARSALRRLLCAAGGLNVLMIDAHQPPHQEGSHHGSTRLIRHAYGEGERYVPLVLRAQQLWDEFAAASGEAVFERTGVINLGPAGSDFLRNVASSARVPAQYRRNGCADGDDSLAGNRYS